MAVEVLRLCPLSCAVFEAEQEGERLCLDKLPFDSPEVILLHLGVNFTDLW